VQREEALKRLEGKLREAMQQAAAWLNRSTQWFVVGVWDVFVGCFVFLGDC